MNRLYYLLLPLILLFWGSQASAQVIGRDSIPKASRRDSTITVLGVPLVFFTPDTRWGAGLAGIITFPTRPRRSSLTFNASYTQNKQLQIYFPFSFLGNRNRWRVYGEIGWYRYLYRYFGIGNKIPNDYVETYTARYPRVRVTAATKVKSKHLVGIRFYLDDYTIASSTSGGLIEQGLVPGARGGVTSSVGPVWIADSRDNAFFPRTGLLAEFALTGEHKLTGSDFLFARCSLDVAKYFPIGRHNVLAVNAIGIFTAGDVPFFQFPQIGGQRRLRGYPDGKYRDRHLVLAQAEFRFKIYWRFKGVLFAGAGTVFGQPNEKPHLRPNGGAGIRVEFDRRQKLHLRLDYGFGEGKGNNGMYVTLGEAF
ncbi:MAG TPA: BamA/TamA family outer membrane protein [Saprospiraceae bacterium]|nr:BamA/TamA family outer membrane protein [Saprospiraceae bacterium]